MEKDKKDSEKQKLIEENRRLIQENCDLKKNYEETERLAKFNTFMMDSIKNIRERLNTLSETYEREHHKVAVTTEAADCFGTCASFGVCCLPQIILPINYLASLVKKCGIAHKKTVY